MESLLSFFLVVALVIGIILILRLVGSWMLRIDEVIVELKKTNLLLLNIKNALKQEEEMKK